jgi:uncharacterized protein DUF2834
MNKKQIALAVVLADFTAIVGYALFQYGYVGIFAQMFANAATVAAATDLTIALAMVAVWMWQDARRHDISPIPYLVLTAALGSAGPLLYLIRRLGHDTVIVPHRVLATRTSAARV